jgi:hypothetical protein
MVLMSCPIRALDCETVEDRPVIVPESVPVIAEKLSMPLSRPGTTVPDMFALAVLKAATPLFVEVETAWERLVAADFPELMIVDEEFLKASRCCC